MRFQQSETNEDTSEVSDYNGIVERFVRFLRFAGLLDLSDFSDLSISVIEKIARTTTEEPTNKLTNRRTDGQTLLQRSVDASKNIWRNNHIIFLTFFNFF